MDHIFGDEYEHKSVPENARRSMFSVAMVWAGFPMIITGAMTGSVLVLGMGFSNALKAMIIGNLIMFAYVGALGLLGTKRGMNFALLGILVPPIGAIILVDQYVTRKNSEIDVDWRGSAFLAWICGSAAAFFVEKNTPEWSTAISAAVVGGVVYYVISMATQTKTKTA